MFTLHSIKLEYSIFDQNIALKFYNYCSLLKLMIEEFEMVLEVVHCLAFGG